MDATFSFSPRPQALTLTSCTQLSSPKLNCLRKNFLGCGQSLRPPGAVLLLRSRRNRSNLWLLPVSSPRFCVRASLNSHSLLIVVAVVTFSAVFVVYLNSRERDKNLKQVSKSPGPLLSQLGRDVMNWIESLMLGFGDFHKENSAKESKGFVDHIGEDSHCSDDAETPLQYQNSVLTSKKTAVARVSGSSGSDVLVCSATDSVCYNSAEVTDRSVSPVNSELGALQPLDFSTGMIELKLEDCQEKTDLDSMLNTLMNRSKCSPASVHLNNEIADVNELDKAKELGEKGPIASDNSFCKESDREELYTFYEGNQIVTTSAANLHGPKSVSSLVSFLDSNGLASLTKDTILEGTELSAQGSLPTAEYTKGKVPIACFKESPSGKRKDLGKGKGFLTEKERRNLPQNSYKNLPKFPHPNGMNVNDELYPSEKLRAYNRLVRDGRLSDCIELLEGMERVGLLDMNKIYHARFFETCKRKKAVKEAFRFTKLVPNPTLSTFNMLMSVCASSQDSEGAFQVRQLVQEAGLKADCKLYTTFISTCAKSGKVDAMFEVFHEMVNAGVEPNVYTYGALIDGCARAGQVAKAFGAYGIMRSKNVKPDRVVFNALITACGQSGAVDRAFDVLAEMKAETQPIDPDHITVGALIKACANAGQVDRAQEVYKMIHEYNIKGTPEVYTIAVSCCSQTGDWEFAYSVYDDMMKKGVALDEMFLSALIDVAGHAGNLDAAFEILQEARIQGTRLGIISYSSLMGACSNAKNWQKALEVYEDIKFIKLKPTVPTMNALITALCDGDQLHKAMEILSELKTLGLCPNTITYSILLVASERKDDLEVARMLHSQAKMDEVAPSLLMCRCIIGMCLRRFEKACALGESVLSSVSGRPQIDNKWTSVALMVYRETIVAGVIPPMEVVSQVLGCLKLPYDASLKSRLVENLGVSVDASRWSNVCSLIDGFGEYDPRAFSLLEEAASLGIVPCVSLKKNPIVVDARKLQIHTAEVYLLTVLKGLKYRLAAGSKLPNITILLPTDKTHILFHKGDKAINLAGRISQAIAALLRRLGLSYQGNESYGKIRINGLRLRRWFQPKLASPFSGKPGGLGSSQLQLGKGIARQQRDIRSGNLSLE